jgi:hypothetical protein
MIPPQTRPGLPLIKATRGTRVRIHLGFAARSPVLTVGGRRVRPSIDGSQRVITWRAASGGIVNVDVRGAGGGTSYVARLRLA